MLSNTAPEWFVAVFVPADSPDFKPRVNWSRFHETMPLPELAKDPYATNPSAWRNDKLGMTSTDGVNGPADITGGQASLAP